MSSFLAFLLLCSFILTVPTNAEEPIYTDCPSNTNYTRGSKFAANMDALLSYLPGAAAASSGFATNVTGTAPDQAYGLAQCRADVNASDCRACLDAAVQDMASKCTAGQKTAMLIYDQCQIRHSNASFFGAVDTSVVVYSWNPQNASQPEQFTATLSTLMDNITQKAAFASPRMFAVGSAAVSPFVKIYGRAQCRRDLSPDDCNSCLNTAVGFIPTCCNEKQGGFAVYRTCAIRFEQYRFYNVQAAEAAMSPAPSPGGGPNNGTVTDGSTGSKRTVRTVLLVAIPVAVTLLVVVPLVALYLCMRNRNQVKIASDSRHGDKEEEIIKV